MGNAMYREIRDGKNNLYNPFLENSGGALCSPSGWWKLATWARFGDYRKLNCVPYGWVHLRTTRDHSTQFAYRRQFLKICDYLWQNRSRQKCTSINIFSLVSKTMTAFYTANAFTSFFWKFISFYKKERRKNQINLLHLKNKDFIVVLHSQFLKLSG